jgi:hypothetical protein
MQRGAWGERLRMVTVVRPLPPSSQTPPKSAALDASPPQPIAIAATSLAATPHTHHVMST